MSDLGAAKQSAAKHIDLYLDTVPLRRQDADEIANVAVDAALATLANGKSVWVVDQERCDTFCDDDKGGDHVVGDCMVEVWPNE